MPARWSWFRGGPWLRNWYEQTSNLLLPPICAGCAVDMPVCEQGIALCTHCRAVFDRPAGTICPRCAAPAPPTSIQDTGCVHCADTSFRFHDLMALGVYEKALQSFLLRMKQAQHEALTLAAGKVLAQALRTQFAASTPVAVTAIPMHWSRRWWRGVNAAAILAEAVSRELSLPLVLDLVSLTKMVPRQSSLAPSRRRRNMSGAFRVSSAFQVRDTHILVIDDVLTTGGTANAFAQALRLAGAKRITFGVVARGIGLNS